MEETKHTSKSNLLRNITITRLFLALNIHEKEVKKHFAANSSLFYIDIKNQSLFIPYFSQSSNIESLLNQQ